MGSAYEALNTRLRDVHNLGMAGAVLDWDQQCYMPPGGVAARADQKATLSKLSHELFISDETGRLLAQAEADGGETEDDQAILRVVRRDYDKATRLPTALVEEKTRVTSLAQEEWAAARQADDYGRFAPWLERILDLCRREAEALGYADRLYDALLDLYEPGMTCAQIDPIFGELRSELIPFSQALFARADCVDGSCLTRDYEIDVQNAYTVDLLKNCGYDFRRGRQDKAVHPFCTHFSKNDVRITTRFDKNYLPSSVFASMHEMGHAFYEMGLADHLEGTPASGGASLGLHESQSRLWENMVGRSIEFWKKRYTGLQSTFPASLGDISLEGFYKAINRVAPTLIRVEADEVTYTLHIILRYEMEIELLEGKLSVADAPEAWNARMQELMGVTPPNHREGILQDVHWSIGILGYFPTYSLGSVLSAQIYDAALREIPDLPQRIEDGDCASLLNWLVENVHRHGRKYLPGEVIERATGSQLQTAPYLRYLKSKFGAIYGV